MSYAIRLTCLLCLVALAALAGVSSAAAQDRSPKPLATVEHMGAGPVVRVPVEGTIDKALARYIDRAIADAEAADAALILLHVDTFGGLLDAADHIRKALLNTSVPTVAFIDRNAASAGALISYAADRIVMVPGASIGAATVVDGVGGAAAPDKYQSYMRGLMRATAEATGRDPRIAEAMVDERVFVEGVDDSSRVLTLSSAEAHRLGVADAVLASTEEVLEEMGLSGREVMYHQTTTAEQVLRFLGSPVLQSLFMLMMLGGLYFELQTPGVGFAGLMAIIGAALFFAPNYLLGLVESWEIVLFFIGVVLLLIEVFILPGFGVAGMTGIVLIVGSLLAALIGNVGFSFPAIGELSSAVATMAVTLVLLVVLIFSLGRYLPRSERFNRLVLTAGLSEEAHLLAANPLDELFGQSGVALTPLRPSGTAEFGGKRVDVITAGEFVPAGTPVEVVHVRGQRVEVRRARVASASETFDA